MRGRRMWQGVGLEEDVAWKKPSLWEPLTGKKRAPSKKLTFEKMTRTDPIGSKPLQVKNLHRKKMDWDQKMGSKKQKNWHRRNPDWDEKMGSKQLQVKNWHLTKMDWEQKMGSKKIKQKLASLQNEWDRKNGKQTASRKKTGILEKWSGTKKWEANRST